MTMNREALITDFIERLQQQITELVPRQSVDAVLEQARRTLHQGFSELDLVPRSELTAHLRTLEQLRDTVESLERRIRELEQQ